LAVSIVFPWRRGFRFDIDHQREPRNTRNTRNVEKKIRRCCARIRFSGSGRSSQVNRVFGPRSEPHDLVAPLVDDRQIDCSLFVCFVCFVVPNLPRSGLQPCSVRSKNLATLSSAEPLLISDLTLICEIVCAFPATWPLVGSFVIFRVFASPTRPPSTAAPRVGTGHRVVGSRQLRKRGSLEDARMARRSYGGTCCLAMMCSTWNAKKSASSS
jgi:hypothetical protein